MLTIQFCVLLVFKVQYMSPKDKSIILEYEINKHKFLQIVPKLIDLGIIL